MPNPTFFNLPEAKRRRLMDAVWQEFTSVSYMDASINKIIQAADISRGSFYQYFSGKQDVFTYILQTIMDAGKNAFQAQLMVHNNDLFAAILGMYDMLLWKHGKTRQDPVFERFHTLFRLNAELDMGQFASLLDREAMAKTMNDMLIHTGYQLASPLQCQALIHLLTSIGISNAADTLRHPSHETHNRQLLESQLELIRKGLNASRQEAAQ